MSSKLKYLQALGVDVWTRRSQVARSDSTPGTARIEAADVPAHDSRGATLVETVVRREQSVAQRIARTGSELPVSIANLDWDGLIQTVSSCTACSLHSTRTQSVFGVGHRQAQWMIIGEAPGAEEDRQGEPFVGRAGQLLNAMLKAIGLEREQVFIANILKSRPPNNRDPRQEEVAACIPFLYRQIELVNPVLLLCVGRIAAQTLLQTDTPIGRLRGTLHRIANNRPMIVTYHPAYLLRSPVEKRKAWNDLKLAVQTFGQLRTEAAS
jgi:uracil-DNA glycosylase family 4